MVDRVSVVRNRRDQLFDHGRDAGSANLPELRKFQVSKAIQDRVLRALFASRDKLKIGCHC